MRVVTEVEDWPRSIRRASINSFGYGGANAHIILESTDSYFDGSSTREKQPNGVCGDKLSLVFPVSAATKKSLAQRKTQLAQTIQKCDSTALWNLAFTLTRRRSQFQYRDFLLFTGDVEGNLTSAQIQSSGLAEFGAAEPLPLAFIFTGQGAQYACMGKELLQRNRIFHDTIRDLDNILQTLPSQYAACWTLRQTILDPPETSKVDEAVRSQPLCTAIQIALVNVLRSWGINPSAAIGHSSGEIGAAYATGLLTAKQAIIVAFFRGYVTNQLQTTGAMVATGLDIESANKFIQDSGLSGQVCVACVNSPESVTLSGTADGIDFLTRKIQDSGQFARKLRTGGRAYHSQMEEAGLEYEALLAPFFTNESKREVLDATMISSVGFDSFKNALELTPDTNMPSYWRHNLERSVQFCSATESLISNGRFHLVEIGPHPTLKRPIQQTQANLKESILPYSATLIRNQDANISMMRLAGILFLQGHGLDWCGVNALPERGLQPLPITPPYPWDYSGDLLWHETRPSFELRARKYARHELLGSPQVAGNGIDCGWRNLLHMDEVPWLSDHKIESQIVFPAAGYMVLALEAITQLKGLRDKPTNLQSGRQTSFEFSNVAIKNFLVLKESLEPKDLELHTTLAPKKLTTTATSNYWYDFSISSWKSGHATHHCAGSVRVVQETIDIPDPLATQNCQEFESESMDKWYEKMSGEGLAFGPHFRSIVKLHTDGNRIQTVAICEAELNAPIPGHPHRTHSSLHVVGLDACLQAALLSDAAGDISRQRAWLPTFISQCRMHLLDASPSLGNATIHARSERSGLSTLNADAKLYDGSGRSFIGFKGVRFSLYTGKIGVTQSSKASHEDRHPCLRVCWKPDIQRLYESAENDVNIYVNDFSKRLDPEAANDELLSIVGSLLDIAAHKMPEMRVLELESRYTPKLQSLVDSLDTSKRFRRYKSWDVVSIGHEGQLSRVSESRNAFDVILHIEVMYS